MASNPSASKRKIMAGTPATARPPFLGATDLRVLAKLPLAGLGAWCLPESWWDALAGHAVGLEGAAIEQLARRITTMLGPDRLTEPARVLARRQLAAIRVDQLCFLRSHRPGGWRPMLRLEGSEHLAAALAAGRGAILWVAPTVFQWLATKRALHEACYPVHHLSSPNHGFSTASWVGTRLLNPIRTRVEDRYLAERVTLGTDGSAHAALRRLTAVLRGNGIVSITVAAAGARPVTVPFLAGSLRAAGGAPQLAARTGAPLLPVVTLREGTGFATRVGAPLARSASGTIDPAPTGLVAALAARLEPYARAHPDQIAWRLDCIDTQPPALAGARHPL